MASFSRNCAGSKRVAEGLLILFLAAAGLNLAAFAQADGDTPVQLNFDNADLNEVINFVAETLGISFMVDPQVAGRVNIKMDKPIRKRDLFAVFETILRMNNATIVKGTPISQIVPITTGVKLPIGVYDYTEFVGKGIPGIPAKASGAATAGSEKTPAPTAPVPAPAPAPAPGAPVQVPQPIPPIPSPKDTELFTDGELAIHIIPVEFLPAEDMRTMLTPFLSNGGTMVIYGKANLLIITDFKDNVKRLRQIISALDGRVFESTYIDLIKIKYYQVKDVAEDLGKVIAGSAKDLNVGVTVIPIERLNSILAVANSQRSMEKIHYWLDKLDTPQGRSSQTFVYPVQNSTANNIATILTQLYSEGAAGGTPAQPSAQTRAQPLSTQRTQQQVQNQPQQLGPRLTGSLNLGEAATGAGPTGAIKIIVDELNNSLVIQATAPDFEYILKTIRLLDVLPRQVLIEAKIFEVGLTDELSLGVRWFFENLGGVAGGGTGTGATSAARTDRTANASIGANKPGQALADVVFQVMTNKQLAVDIVALRNRTVVKALQAPSLMAMDGKEAKIEVGEEVPVSTSTLSTATQVAANQSYFNQIQYRPTGIILVINPRITASGMVSMEIAQEVSQVSGGEALTPKVSKSAVNTSVVLKDGEGVVIAGVIRENLSTNRTRVPGLGDIPLLGYLFGTSSRSLIRSELIVLITPRVIKTPEQHAELTLDVESQFQQLNQLIRVKQRELMRNANQWRKELEEEQRKEAERKQKELEKQQSNLPKSQEMVPAPAPAAPAPAAAVPAPAPATLPAPAPAPAAPTGAEPPAAKPDPKIPPKPPGELPVQPQAAPAAPKEPGKPPQPLPAQAESAARKAKCLPGLTCSLPVQLARAPQ